VNPAAVLAIERCAGVHVVTLCRPPVNALDATMIERLEAALDEAAADPDTAVLHIRSRLATFCAGADLALMRSCFETAQGRDAMVDLVRRMQSLFARFESAPLVTIAELGGAAMGGGLELALACDLRVAATTARLGLPEARLGLLPAAGGTQRLTRLCGEGAAKRLILGAETIDGAEALRLGLVQWTRPDAELEAWTRALAERLAGLPKAALAACKRCIAAERDPACEGFDAEIAATRALYDDGETRRRVSAFLARSKS
jgi:enoyl-CoA hydratase/carnithine racemase